MNYYQWHIGDYRRDTAHLTLLEHGAYRQLLDSYYLNEIPLPADDATLMRSHCARSADEMQAIRNVLNDFFLLTADGWVHSHCNKVIGEYHEKSETAKASANARWERERAKKNANALPSQSEGNANQEPLTNNHKPITNIKPSSIPSTDVVEVFEHWRSVMQSPKSKLDDKRRSLITKSLKLGYTAEQLKAAIDGCARTPHNMGVNDRNTKFNSLGLILRDADNIDRFMGTPTGSNHAANQPIPFRGAASAGKFIPDHDDTSWAHGLDEAL